MDGLDARRSGAPAVQGPVVVLQRDGGSLAGDCVRYGFCVAVCPTYDLLQSEQDGPRGRIVLIREMLASGGAPAKSTVLHLDRCLSCSACMSPCGAGVNYRRLIDVARAYIERTYSRPPGERLQRYLILRVLTRPWLTRTLLAAARRIPAWLLPLVPGILRPFISVATSLDGPDRASRHRMDVDGTGPRGCVFLLEGCVQAAVAPRINSAAESLYRRNGYSVVRSVASRCCGALALHMGHPEQARGQAGQILDEVSSRGIETITAIVSTASGCGAVIREYGELFKGTPREALADRVASLVRDPVEVIDSLPQPIKSEVDARFSVAVHEPCSLRFVQKSPDSYANALRRVGLDASAVRDGYKCCGSAGSYSILQPDLAAELGKRRAAQIAESGAPLVVSANIGCIMQLGRYLDRRPVHALELLDWINGGRRPPELDGWEQWPRRASERSEAQPAIW